MPPNLDNLNLTEKAGNFELRYISLDDVEEELKKNAKEFEDPHGITKEMLNLIKIYKNNEVNNENSRI